MAVRVDSTIYVPGTEAGSEAPRDLRIDPFPTTGSGVEINAGQFGRVVGIDDMRAALDHAERLQREDGR